MSKTATAKQSSKISGQMLNRQEKQTDVRMGNIQAAKTIADIMRTSLGPKGMDKMMQTSKGETLITNDGATILGNLSVIHPTAKLLVQTSKAQDVEAGDGTTSVVIIAGALLKAAQTLLIKGIHPTMISDGFALALTKALDVLNSVAKKVDLNNQDELEQCVKTALSSKVVSQNSTHLAPLSIKAVRAICDLQNETNVDLRDIKIVKKMGGVIDDIELINGLVFADNKPARSAGGPTKVENPKIAMLQFCISKPKTDMDNNIQVNDYSQIDRLLKEERRYIFRLVKKIAASGANVVLVQKSVLRDSVSDLALHYLAKKKIMVVRNIERTDVEHICKTINCTPVAHIDQLTPEKLGTAMIAEDHTLSDGARIFRVLLEDTAKPPTVTMLLRGSNNLVLDEAERSIHDGLCVVRSLVKKKAIIPGGGAIEIEIWRALEDYSNTLESGPISMVVREFAEAMEVIPFTLAENCGINPMKTVTELRNRHKNGQIYSGLKAKNGKLVENCLDHKIMQPALVTISALTLATEVTKMILKIDDILSSR